MTTMPATMASQITSLTIVYSTVYSDADQRKHQSSASLAFVWGIHRDRWIPRTKGQLRGQCLMASSWHRIINMGCFCLLDSIFATILLIHIAQCDKSEHILEYIPKCISVPCFTLGSLNVHLGYWANWVLLCVRGLTFHRTVDWNLRKHFNIHTTVNENP